MRRCSWNSPSAAAQSSYSAQLALSRHECAGTSAKRLAGPLPVVRRRSTQSRIPRVDRVLFVRDDPFGDDNPCFASHRWDWHADCSSALKEEVPKAVPGPTFLLPARSNSRSQFRQSFLWRNPSNTCQIARRSELTAMLPVKRRWLGRTLRGR